ncbi:MAG: glycosyltransferase family 2 protein [Methanobacterium sp.]
MAYPKVSIIILNWNGWKDTVECLESVYQIGYPNYNVILVDNASEDDSIEKIRSFADGNIKVESEFFNDNLNKKAFNYIQLTKEEIENKKFNGSAINDSLILIKNDKNYGYAEGNNIGIKFALNNIDPDYILILNNDIVVEKNFLSELVKVAENKKDAGFIGPKTYYYDFKGRKDIINFIGGKFNIWIGLPFHIGENEVDRGQFDETKEVDYIEGSCMLVKKDLINEIGLISNEFFLYWEENDWCYRAFKSNYKMYYAHKAKIWHKSSVSIKKLGTGEYYMIRNRIFFMKKYANKAQMLTFLLFLIGIHFWIRCLRLILNNNFKTLNLYLNGLFTGLFKNSVKVSKLEK